MNMRRFLAALCAILMIPSALSAAAVPDVLMPGYKGIRHSITIDLGSFAETALRQHLVGEGDTLAGLSGRYLGDASRWREIASLNPGVDPKKLKPRSKLLIPSLAKAKNRKASDPVWQFYWWADRGFGRLPKALYGNGGEIRMQYGGEIIAIPFQHRAEFDAQFKKLKRHAWKDIKVFGLVRSQRISEIRSVKETHPAERIESTYLVKKITGKKLLVERNRHRHLDARGEVVKGSFLGGSPLLVALTLLAGGAIAILGARRRRALAQD